VIGNRTRAREIALQALFCGDLVEGLPAETAKEVIGHAEANHEVKAFAEELSLGVLAQIGEIDRRITSAADNWDIKRLAVVDRNVLRLAVFEMIGREDIPARVSINEAIELSKRFSTAQSGGFVNGILDRVRRDLGIPEEAHDDLLAEPLPESEQPPTSFAPQGEPGTNLVETDDIPGDSEAS
jgi:transcription antitermination factor NusB